MKKNLFVFGIICSCLFAGCHENQKKPETDITATSINIALAEKGEITALNLSKQNLTAFPNIADFPKIKKIYVRKNQISDWSNLPNSIFLLDLAENNLTALPNAKATQLYASDNKLKTISTISADCEYLNLDRNLLESLPDLSGAKLKFLRLNENNLMSLPRLPATLQRIYLANNKLTEIPQITAEALPNIKVIILTGNPITATEKTRLAKEFEKKKIELRF